MPIPGHDGSPSTRCTRAHRRCTDRFPRRSRSTSPCLKSYQELCERRKAGLIPLPESQQEHAPAVAPVLIVLTSLRPVTPWRIGLHQSPPPLHQPVSIFNPPAETVNHDLARPGGGIGCPVGKQLFQGHPRQFRQWHFRSNQDPNNRVFQLDIVRPHQASS